MKTTVTVGSANVVEFFKQHQYELACEYETIAENEDCGIVIYLSSTNGRPTVTVLADEDQISEIITGIESLENVVRTTYDTYLSEQAVISLMTKEGDVEDIDEDELIRDEIDERESEIDAAVDDFLGIIAQTYGFTDDNTIDEIHDDVKEHFLEYLYRKHKLEIYRPMILEDENGEDFFEEYPYECMEFDDETNPIYMDSE